MRKDLIFIILDAVMIVLSMIAICLTFINYNLYDHINNLSLGLICVDAFICGLAVEDLAYGDKRRRS